jgi:phosphatidylglycerol---prolipoprotein diacylglyceryl transferase
MIGLEIAFPQIDPVAFTLGPLTIKWYGLAYLAGLLLGAIYIRKLLNTPRLWPKGVAPFSADKVDDLLIYMTIGVIIGGRLGSVLLYEPGTYINDPLRIFMIWKGGMAFHGALAGTGVAAWLFARHNNTNLWSTMDLCAAAVPIGLFFGRLANFINGELFGRPTDVPWGMVFPTVAGTFPQLAAIEPTPRHPSQLYEAGLEGLAMFLILWVMIRYRDAFHNRGSVIGTFLIGYALARSFSELFRQPDPAHALTFGVLTPGIAYSIPMLLIGIYFLSRVRANATVT